MFAFLSSSLSKTLLSSTIPLNVGSVVTSGPLGTHGHPGVGGVVFSKDLRWLEVGSVSDYWLMNVSHLQDFSNLFPFTHTFLINTKLVTNVIYDLSYYNCTSFSSDSWSTPFPIQVVNHVLCPNFFLRALWKDALYISFVKT